MVFDDFRGPEEWSNLVRAMKQVDAERTFELLTSVHPIFSLFL